MVPGGEDVLLLAPAGECVADVILRTCQFHWRGHTCVFQDVEEEPTHPFTDPWVWTVGTMRRDFFVFRDQQAADSWEKNGAVKENRNTMFHFLLGDSGRDSTGLLEVAVVFDKKSPEVAAFLDRLRTGFLSLMPLEAA